MPTLRKHIIQLVEVSRFFGSDQDYVIAGGGNTSFKNEDFLWIKASGIPLAFISEHGFVCMSRSALQQVGDRQYSSNPLIREEEVKKAIASAVVSPENLRPSVETSLHNVVDFAYVVHTHPTLVNGLMCSVNAGTMTRKLFGDEAIYLEYTDPGFTLFNKVREKVVEYAEKHGESPAIIFLQNHGVFVGADSIDEIKETYKAIHDKILGSISIPKPAGYYEEIDSDLLLRIQNYLEEKGILSKGYRGELIEHFTESRNAFSKIERPFTPDVIVYCKSHYLFLERDIDHESVAGHIENFRKEHGYYPKVILKEGAEMIICDENERSVETVRDVFLDMMKISLLSENFGGPHFMSEDQIAFIDNWEVENYRRKVAKQQK